jgi:plasmid stabilization system protein ParE
MAKEKIYEIVIAQPAKNRYHEDVLPYIYENFSFERAIEVDENILRAAGTLNKKPGRGRKEKYLEEAKEEFKFILHKETKHLEIKIIYYINEVEGIVYITDFFPTKMNPQRISKRK